MSISVLASRPRRRAVLAGALVVAVIGFFESNVVEICPVAPAQSVMQAHVTAENAGTARASSSGVGEPVSYRLADEQDEQTDQADDDWAQQQEEEQQQEQQQEDWDQLQNQLNTQQQLNQQSIQQSEQEAQEQNDAAEQQAEQDEQQAQMDEQQADQ